VNALAVTFFAQPETFPGASHEVADRTGEEQQYPVIPSGLCRDMHVGAGRYC
jgi:hypothetical protein